MKDYGAPRPTYRPNSQNVELYNDGLIVFLYDELNREEIRKSGIVSQVSRLLSSPEAAIAPELTAFAEKGILVAYELFQDDSIDLDIIEGPPLQTEELGRVKQLKWLPSQHIRLKIPSGTLCIETLNSIRIDPEDEPQEPAGEVQVQPGDYILTLHRVNQSGPAGIPKSYKGPMEIVTLEPISPSIAIPPSSIMLPYVPPPPEADWVGAYEIKGATAKCQVKFLDFWEMFEINLNRRAVDELGIDFGSCLELTIAKCKYVIVYTDERVKIGILTLNAFKKIFGNDNFSASLKEMREVAFGQLTIEPKLGAEKLLCMRVKASEAFRKKQGKWLKAEISVMQKKLKFEDADFENAWRIDDGWLCGRILLASKHFIAANFNRAALDRIGIIPGTILEIETAGTAMKAKYFEELGALLKARSELNPYNSANHKKWQALVSKHILASEDDRGPVIEQMKEFLRTDVPLAALPVDHWFQKDMTVMIVHPQPSDQEAFDVRFETGLPAILGNPIRLRKL